MSTRNPLTISDLPIRFGLSTICLYLCRANHGNSKHTNMQNTQDMTNGEFMEHLMEGYSKHGALVQMVVLDCLQKGLDHYIEIKDELLENDAKMREEGKVSFVNMEAWIACCEETKQRIEEKYS